MAAAELASRGDCVEEVAKRLRVAARVLAALVDYHRNDRVFAV